MNPINELLKQKSLRKKSFACEIYLDNGEKVLVRFNSEYITPTIQMNTIVSCFWKGYDVSVLFGKHDDYPSGIMTAVDNNAKSQWLSIIQEEKN